MTAMMPMAATLRAAALAVASRWILMLNFSSPFVRFRTFSGAHRSSGGSPGPALQARFAAGLMDEFVTMFRGRMARFHAGCGSACFDAPHHGPISAASAR
jgi:hypothetical protein